MSHHGTTRADLVFLNRVNQEYQQDQLPNLEQVRHDVARLLQLVAHLIDTIEKMDKDKEQA